MDPNAFVYCQKKGKLEKRKIRKLKKGDIIVAVSKDWNIKMVKVNTVFVRILPSILVTKYTFKNGNTLIASDCQKLTKLYNAPYNEDEPLDSGTFMTFKYENGNRYIGMTEIQSAEGLEQNVLVRLYALNCEENNNLTNGIIVNGVPVNSFNLSQ